VFGKTAVQGGERPGERSGGYLGELPGDCSGQHSGALPDELLEGR